jgi:hypothetical protein
MKKFIILFLFALFLAATLPVFAVTYTASLTGNWSNTATWGGSGPPSSSTDIITVNAGISVHMDAVHTINGLTLNGGGSTIDGTYALTLTGNVTVNITGSSGATIACPVIVGAPITFTVADDGTSALDLTISGNIGGTSGITKAGAGTLALTGELSATGGTPTIDGNYTVRTFTSSGSSTVTGSGYMDVLVVAGGGGGGSSAGGGGGAGGLLYNASFGVTAQAYPVTVGGGGAGGTGSAGSKGSNSSFSTLISVGGGAGGMGESDASNHDGGSGGGQGRTGGSRGGAVGLGTSGQGNNGGAGSATGGTDN